MTLPVLVLNCGSSSIKFALFDGAVEPLPPNAVCAGRVEGIGWRHAMRYARCAAGGEKSEGAKR